MPVSDFPGKWWSNAGVLDDIGVSDPQEIPVRLMSMVLHTLEAVAERGLERVRRARDVASASGTGLRVARRT
eukprot:5832509-Lingulodinium_polyedra.AAC.1